ncbi:MAG: hypothetical protein LUE26_03775 [Alistipes sp.]|nr:hypothetical protein [Alistipes sp.]
MGGVEWRVQGPHGQPVELPVAVRLNGFDIEEYPPALAVMDRGTGGLLPEGRPGYLQLADGDRAVIDGREITVTRYIHHAVPDGRGGYREAVMPASAPAAEVRVRDAAGTGIGIGTEYDAVAGAGAGAGNSAGAGVNGVGVGSGNGVGTGAGTGTESGAGFGAGSDFGAGAGAGAGSAVVTGWVSYGSAAQPAAALDIGGGYSVVMTRPEPRRFISDVEAFTPDGRSVAGLLEVNRPLRLGHWRLYQYGYDTQAGRMSQYSVIELVYDPWAVPVYVGIILLGAGSVCMLWSGRRAKAGRGDGK